VIGWGDTFSVSFIRMKEWPSAKGHVLSEYQTMGKVQKLSNPKGIDHFASSPSHFTSTLRLPFDTIYHIQK
jgi:hypothetical protein